MKVVHVMTYAHGGAGTAALRIHQAMQAHTNWDSHVVCLSGNQHDENVHVIPRKLPRFWERGAARLGLPMARVDREAKRRKRLAVDNVAFSEVDSDYDITSLPQVQEADVVHLHWVGGLLDWRSFLLETTKPVVWTLHDMNPFLGGFHYEGDRARATTMARKRDAELAKRKSQILQGRKKFEAVYPSQWLRNQAARSDIFAAHSGSVIRNCVDPQVYRAYDQRFARDVLGLPIDARVFLTVAERLTDYRKGADILRDALASTPVSTRYVLASVGNRNHLEVQDDTHLGTIGDPRLMALAYSAADALIVPSREDNLPNVIVESMMVGTPVIATPAGGIPEMIVEGVNGIVASAITASALSAAIQRSYCDFDRTEIRRLAISKYDPAVVAEAYAEVYWRAMDTA